VNPLDPYMMLVSIEMTAGNGTRAFELADVVRAHFDEIAHNSDEARILAGFAVFEAMAGRLDAARADSERAVQVAQRSGNQPVLPSAMTGRARAPQRDDPEGALAVAEQFLELFRRSGVARSVAPGVAALAAGLRGRLGDDRGALPILRDAAVIARDDGALPS